MMKVTAEIEKGDWIEEKMSRKDESHRRDRQKKEEWIGVKISRKDENHSRDR